MPRIRPLLRDTLILTFLTLPVFAAWTVQKRAGERVRDPASGSHQGTVRGVPPFAGLPYIHLSAAEAGGGRAVGVFSELVRKQERELGPSHQDTLVSRNNLANALQAEGRCVEAEAAQRELLADMERVLEPGHPDIFRCRFNLALNLRTQGRKEDARHEMESVYEGWREVLGERHPRTQEARLVLDHF